MSALPETSLAVTTRLLAELALTGEALAEAAATGDLIAALAAAHETRRLRAELARHPLPDVAGDAEVAVLAPLVGRGRAAADIVARWRDRPLPPPARMMSSPLGVACFADHLLPATWDVTRDLVVLVGRGLEPVAAMLGDLGQRRVLVVGDPGASSYPAGTTVVADAREAGHVVRLMSPLPPERVVVRSLDGDEVCGAIAEAVHTALCDLRVQHNTVQAFSRTWLAQGAANLDAIARCPSVDAVGDDFAGVPMIICAPGPSLAGNIAQLRAVRGRAIVVAVSHALRALRAAGVVPDLVVTVDPQDVRYHFAAGDLDGVGALVNGVTVFPALYQLGAARHMTLASNGALDRWLYQDLGDAAEVPGGGSVATTALSLGLRWRCDPIVMVGLDLSFAGGRYYVGTSCDGDAHAVIEDGHLRVAGWSDGFQRMKAMGGPAAARERIVELPSWRGDGSTVPSSFMFAMFHRWFVDTAQRVTAAGDRPRLYNCTEGGARIDGMEHVPLAEVLAGLTASHDIAAVLDRAQASVDPESRAAAADRWRQRTIAELRRAARLAERGVALAARPGGSPRLRGIERALGALLARHDFVAMLAQRDIDAALDEAGRPASETAYLTATGELLAAAARTAHDVVSCLIGVSRAP